MKKNNLFSHYAVAILFVQVFLLPGCTDNTLSPDIPPQNEKYTYANLIFSDKIELSNYPTFGSMSTNFKFDIILKDASLKISKIKYDFTYDNEYDTLLVYRDTVNTRLKQPGSNKIICSVELDDKTVLSCSTSVWITQPRLISSDGYVFFEPNIYNGKMISVTHGSGHLIQLIDFNTLQMNCYFCGFPADPFNEMHCSIPSFDGNKILYSYQMHKLAYYDFVKNDSTVTILPINTTSYPVGQVTWSLDNKSIIYVSVDDINQLNGIKSYNFESNQINNLYNNNSGSYICVIPDQNEKIAILEKINESKNKLIIYNITSKAIEKEYNDIPFYAPFRMLRGDRVCFDGKLALYSLSTQKTDYMNFGELNLSGHGYGEADINMDGNVFVLGTWKDTRALYYITLPN